METDTIQKLELKHLAPYLPYNLKMVFEKSGRTKELTGLFVDNGELRFCFGVINQGEKIWPHKPILRPLSDLLKVGSDLKPIYFPSKYALECINNPMKDILICDYNEVDYLIKNHFDVFGLIEKGLAIDINTLNN